VGSATGPQPSVREEVATTNAFAWHVQSLLLGFPDDHLVGRLGLLRQISSTLHTRVGYPLDRFIDYAGQRPAAQLAAEYLDTFDRGETCHLCLTYYTHGNTGGRQLALRRLEQIYAAGGERLTGGEMPDHLAVMLRYAATAPQSGHTLLVEQRPAVQLLRLALRDAGSPWADVLDSVWATLPPPDADEWMAAARLAAVGPVRIGAGPGPGFPRPRPAP
jgi:nitrate reductase molybdenum cofactor assembly chaperone NarJ/NarW